MKYSKEFKLEAVQSYLSGEVGGYRETSKLYGLSDKKNLRLWVKRYREEGELGLDDEYRRRMRKKPKQEDEQAEMRRLRVENEYLRKIIHERELKKKIRY